VLEKLPFSVEQIQTDNGSEFAAWPARHPTNDSSRKLSNRPRVTDDRQLHIVSEGRLNPKVHRYCGSSWPYRDAPDVAGSPTTVSAGPALASRASSTSGREWILPLTGAESLSIPAGSTGVDNKLARSA
jgi:hypothetical protein